MKRDFEMSAFSLLHTLEVDMNSAVNAFSLFYRLAMELNGTCTGEHGIGMGKRSLMEKEVGEVGLQAMKTIKKAFDPNNILNPGKVFY